jgi:Protein of unknown function (DUF2938)
MNLASEFLIRSLLIGAGATLTMDLWSAALRRFGIPSLDFALLGRWLAHLPRGRFIHTGIASTAPVPGELWFGWCAHYAIGVSFAALLLAIFGLEWGRSPTLGAALLVGVSTVLAPWFLLQPGLGAGVASSRTKTPLFNAFKSLASHTVFGLGLFLSARATALLVSEIN